MHHNKQEHNHHLLAISNSDSKDPAFLEGNLQNAHNSKVLNIPNIFFGEFYLLPHPEKHTTGMQICQQNWGVSFDLIANA